VFGNSSFSLIESTGPLSLQNNLLDKDLWKGLFSILAENADLSLHLEQPLTNGEVEQITSFMKLNGFTNVHIQDSTIQGKKP
jgi:hypothetical protein